MRILEDTDIQFIPNRRKAYIFSGVLIVLSLLSMATRGFQMGIEFTGGREFIIESSGAMSATEVRVAVTEALGTQPVVKRFGDLGMLVRTAAEGETGAIQASIMQAIQSVYPDAELELASSNVVGARFAEDLKRGALYAVLGSLLVIFVYILIRFQWTYSVGALAALSHDVIIALGCFSALAGVLPFSLQIDQTIIAAFLTIVGYSINDTVVVFDRIREFENIFKAKAFGSTVNRSINDTLSRTIVTSGTTLLVAAALFIFGSEVLRGFSFALLIGVVLGTYSSIFVASPIVTDIRRYQEAERRPAGA